MTPPPDNLGTGDGDGPTSPAGGVTQPGSGAGSYTPAVVVTDVSNARYNMFAANVLMPDKSRFTLYLPRASVSNNTVELSIRAASVIWSQYPSHRTRGA